MISCEWRMINERKRFFVVYLQMTRVEGMSFFRDASHVSITGKTCINDIFVLFDRFKHIG